jgi:hypothetical protein
MHMVCTSIFRGTNSLLQLLIQFARTIVECLVKKVFFFGIFDPKIGSPLLSDDDDTGDGGGGGTVNVYFMDMFTRLWLSRPTATIHPAAAATRGGATVAPEVIIHKRRGEKGTSSVSYIPLVNEIRKKLEYEWYIC